MGSRCETPGIFPCARRQARSFDKGKYSESRNKGHGWPAVRLPGKRGAEPWMVVGGRAGHEADLLHYEAGKQHFRRRRTLQQRIYLT